MYQMEKTYSKTLAARHGRGTAWARHDMCESALNLTFYSVSPSRICLERTTTSGGISLLILPQILATPHSYENEI